MKPSEVEFLHKIGKSYIELHNDETKKELFNPDSIIKYHKHIMDCIDNIIILTKTKCIFEIKALIKDHINNDPLLKSYDFLFDAYYELQYDFFEILYSFFYKKYDTLYENNTVYISIFFLHKFEELKKIELCEKLIDYSGCLVYDLYSTIMLLELTGFSNETFKQKIIKFFIKATNEDFSEDSLYNYKYFINKNKSSNYFKYIETTFFSEYFTEDVKTEILRKAYVLLFRIEHELPHNYYGLYYPIIFQELVKMFSDILGINEFNFINQNVIHFLITIEYNNTFIVDNTISDSINKTNIVINSNLSNIILTYNICDEILYFYMGFAKYKHITVNKLFYIFTHIESFPENIKQKIYCEEEEEEHNYDNYKRLIENTISYCNNTFNNDNNIIIIKLLNIIFSYDKCKNKNEYFNILITNYSIDLLEILYNIAVKSETAKDIKDSINTIYNYNTDFYYVLLYALYYKNETKEHNKIIKYVLFLFTDKIYNCFTFSPKSTFLTEESTKFNMFIADEDRNRKLLTFYETNKKCFTDESNRTFLLLCFKMNITDIFSLIKCKNLFNNEIYSNYRNEELFTYIFNIYSNEFKVWDNKINEEMGFRFKNIYGDYNTKLFFKFRHIVYNMPKINIFDETYRINENVKNKRCFFEMNKIPYNYTEMGSKYSYKYFTNIDIFKVYYEKLSEEAINYFYVEKKYNVENFCKYYLCIINSAKVKFEAKTSIKNAENITLEPKSKDGVINIINNIEKFTKEDLKAIFMKTKYICSYNNNIIIDNKIDKKNNTIIRLNTFPFTNVKKKRINGVKILYLYEKNKVSNKYVLLGEISTENIINNLS